MKLLLKEFLTFDEVGDYLKVRGYDLSNDDKECYNQVKSILLDLSRERGLKVVFYYYGDVYIYRAGDKDRKPMNDKKAFFKGYVTHENLTYFLDNKGKEWKSYKGDFEFPRFFHPFYSKNVTFLTNFDIDNELRDLIYLDLLELQNIKACDLRISLTELQDILANIEKSYYKELSQQVADQQATIDQQAKEITKLKEQLASIEQADKDTQSDTPADGEPTDKGQGDSLLILGAVMATMPKLKPNYTQQSHITEILETYKNVSGISQSTLEKKFSQAKRYLKQCIN